jgi:5-methyltetrahydropteroyltriglutamate--homocysteine methyltransferase
MPSADHILTTHVGSLPRPQDLTRLMFAHQEGVDAGTSIDERLPGAVDEIVRWQAAAGIEIVSDGEFGKPGFFNYVTDRLTGFGGEADPMWTFHDLSEIPDAAASQFGSEGFAHIKPANCIGDVSYIGAAQLERDIANLTSAMAKAGAEIGFLAAPAPGCLATHMPNHHYGTYEEYLMACADAMSVEYRAIIDAGLVLQLDSPDIPCLCPRHSQYWCTDVVERMGFAEFVALQVEAVNRATEGLPAEQMRMHVCWANYFGTHHLDAELSEFLEQVLKARPAGLLFESANPRHQHEWRAFEEVDIPDDKILIPGVLDTVSIFVEHPQVIADRLEPFVRMVGFDRVQAGTDCGFGTFVGVGAIPQNVIELKFKSMVEGCRIAMRATAAS